MTLHLIVDISSIQKGGKVPLAIEPSGQFIELNPETRADIHQWHTNVLLPKLQTIAKPVAQAGHNETVFEVMVQQVEYLAPREGVSWLRTTLKPTAKIYGPQGTVTQIIIPARLRESYHD